jgi:hypothetical protein
MIIKILVTIVLLGILLPGCGEKTNLPQKGELELKMNDIAEQYVRLVLEIGIYKPDYVDAYYGPDEWKPVKEPGTIADSIIITLLTEKVDDLLNKLEGLSEYEATGLETKRYRFLYKQLLSVKGMINIIAGVEFSFDMEAKILYDAEVPQHSPDYFQNILDELETILPGEGTLSKRLDNFRNQFIISAEKLDTVFTAAINECRNRTSKYIVLPEGENFKVEYVNDKPWGAYNWYKGNCFSVIQVNTDLPVYVDRAVDLAAHEGYPGHHVYNTLLEEKLTKQKGWKEFSVYPLQSPISLIAEGTANFGIEMAFSKTSRMKFEKEVLFPLANLDSSQVDLYYKVLELTDKLSYAGNEAARNYLDGNWDRDATLNYMVNLSLRSEERAIKSLEFIEKYRSYVINYNLGKDLVRQYIEKNGGSAEYPERRWQLFEELLSTPQTPSGLID